jgi:hypothetical protein
MSLTINGTSMISVCASCRGIADAAVLPADQYPRKPLCDAAAVGIGRVSGVMIAPQTLQRISRSIARAPSRPLPVGAHRHGSSMGACNLLLKCSNGLHRHPAGTESWMPFLISCGNGAWRVATVATAYCHWRNGLAV